MPGFPRRARSGLRLLGTGGCGRITLTPGCGKVSHRRAGRQVVVVPSRPTGGLVWDGRRDVCQGSSGVSEFSETRFAVGHSRFARLQAGCPTSGTRSGRGAYCPIRMMVGIKRWMPITVRRALTWDTVFPTSVSATSFEPASDLKTFPPGRKWCRTGWRPEEHDRF